uniref:Mas2 n=1 Tax=Nicotiana tomentosiformis TaxID=4098 RepID=A0A088F9T8_NICTO|nr:Mas2' [Agrobacterium rhizogenes] [Nicotiana tomentosiformis]
MDLLYEPSSTSAIAISEQLRTTLQQLEAVAESGRTTSAGIERVLFVSAGAGLAIARSLKRYTDEIGRNLRYEAYASATFVNLMHVNAQTVNDTTTLVVLSSKSGMTPETVEAAALLKDKACKSVVFTASANSKLASFGHQTFCTGKTTQAFQAIHMLMLSFIGGILNAREHWALLPALVSSLQALPAALFKAAEKGVQPGIAFAARFAEDHPLYFIASGCAGIVSHAFGLCILQERFGLEIHTVDGADFFHSFVETVRPDKRSHYVLVIPDDASRPQMLDVKTFFENQFKEGEISFQVIKTEGLDISGIDPRIGKVVGPMICEAFLKPWATALAEATGKTMQDPLLHMGKFDYYNCHQPNGPVSRLGNLSGQPFSITSLSSGAEGAVTVGQTLTPELRVLGKPR